MTNRWVLGASDPEMERIEALLREAGEAVVHATAWGRRCHPGNAYACDPVASATHWVECAPAGGRPAGAVVVDHHRPGDPGWGVVPAEFLRGSSVGQVVAELARMEDEIPPPPPAPGPGISSSIRDDGWDRGVPEPTPAWGRGHPSARAAGEFILRGATWWVVDDADAGRTRLVPGDLLLAAAADHCLAAAYRGDCPGVNPEALAAWRAETRAVFQGRSAQEVLVDVERARDALDRARRFMMGGQEVADMRPGQGTVPAGEWGDVPELPEAAVRDGIAFIAIPRPGPDGRRKVVLQAAGPVALAAWPAWAAGEGLIDLYGGDPARGFAGGYVS